MTPALIFGWLPVIGVTRSDAPIITFYALFFVFFAVGFLIGWTRARRPWLQIGFALLVCGLYATYLVWAGALASQCWDCTDGSGEDGRGMGYLIGVFWLGIWMGVCLVALGAGLLASRLTRRPTAQVHA